jgi:hypothetical protein
MFLKGLGAAPLCFQVPLYKTGRLCLDFKFDEIETKNDSLSGCSNLTVKLGTEDLAAVKLGCFKLASSTVFNSESEMSLFSTRTGQDYFYDQMSYLERSGRYLMRFIGKPFKIQKLAYKRRSV